MISQFLYRTNPYYTPEDVHDVKMLLLVAFIIILIIAICVSHSMLKDYKRKHDIKSNKQLLELLKCELCGRRVRILAHHECMFNMFPENELLFRDFPNFYELNDCHEELCIYEGSNLPFYRTENEQSDMAYFECNDDDFLYLCITKYYKAYGKMNIKMFKDLFFYRISAHVQGNYYVEKNIAEIDFENGLHAIVEEEDGFYTLKAFHFFTQYLTDNNSIIYENLKSSGVSHEMLKLQLWE